MGQSGDSQLAFAEVWAENSSTMVAKERLTIDEVVKRAAQYLADKGSPTARLDAELLLGHVLGMTRLQLYLDRERPLHEEELSRMRELVRRRAQHEPVAYIVGHKEFFGRDFRVTPAVLIPRPETELLVETVLHELASRFPAAATWRVLEFGAGSGAIAVTLAAENERVHVVATELSPAAAEIARENAERHGVASRVEIRVQSDFAGLADPFHALVSNPPYVAEADSASLPPDVRDFEPDEALFGGPDGMRWIEWLLRNSRELLEPRGGFLALEIGAGMSERVHEAGQGQGWQVAKIVPDYAGIERVVVLNRT